MTVIWPRRRRDASSRVAPERALFIIGAARSGTTILQNALNHAPEIFLLGETKLHLDNRKPGFAARYNAMHKKWNNQATKSTYLPVLGKRDGGWDEHFVRLGNLYQWVGAKIVFNAGHPAVWTERFLRFHNRHFYNARYLFTMRDPLSVLRSTANMRQVKEGDLSALAQNYAEVLTIFTHMLRTMPNVRVVFHDEMDKAAFASLGEWLGVRLDGCDAYYQQNLVVRYDDEGLTETDHKLLAVLSNLYSALREEAKAGFPRLQIQQNDVSILGGKGIEALGLINAQAGFLANLETSPTWR